METHAPHLHEPHRKKFHHYFFEFFMLFLAVYCGFIAENIREHAIEHNRVEDYAASLVQDLRNDTAAIHAHERASLIYIAIADSLVKLSQSRLEGINAAKFSFYTRFAYWTQSIDWNRATFDQIKNSGSLRYFKSQVLLEKILRYNAILNGIEAEAYAHQERGNMLLNQINTIIDPAYHQILSKYFLYDLDTLSAEPILSLYPAGAESLENSRHEIKQMLNMVIVQQRNLQRDINVSWKQAETTAVELLNELEKEYDIE